MHQRNRRLLPRLGPVVGVWCVVVGSSAFAADTFPPMLMHLAPSAVQVGAVTEVEFNSRYTMSGAYQVIVTGEGVTATVEPEPAKPFDQRPNVTKLKVKFTVAADATPGLRDVRLVVPQGATTLGQLVVVRDPIVREQEPNDTASTAQAVALPAAVCGAIGKAEDVDVYKFTAAAGQALTFHVHSQRLQNRLIELLEHSDPIITLKSATGVVLAEVDNTYAGDPLLHHRFEKAGEYLLEIRDVRYGGTPNWQYVVEINDRPFVTGIDPCRVTPGQPIQLKLSGFNVPADATATLTVPADAPDGVRTVGLPLPTGASNPVAVVVSRLPDVREAAGDNNTVARAQPLTVPVAVSGTIEKPGDQDCYSFTARAGEKFNVAMIARARQSAIDPCIRILNDKGQPLAENDDFTDRFVHPDSRLEGWTAPKDGTYVVEVRDLHQEGGPMFGYVLEITRAEPTFVLELDTDKTIVGPGMSAALFARIRRVNGFAGEVKLSIEGLPDGVTASCGVIPPGDPKERVHARDGCIILTAAAGTKPVAANVRVFGTALIEGKSVQVPARPLVEIYMPGGGRYHFPAILHTVAVADQLDLTEVTITPDRLELKPGESKPVTVKLVRQPGFTAPISLDAAYQHLGTIYGTGLPPGVKVSDKGSKTLLNGTASEGVLVFEAAADAPPVADQQVAVMAHVSMNFVMKFTYAAAPLRITVTGK